VLGQAPAAFEVLSPAEQEQLRDLLSRVLEVSRAETAQTDTSQTDTAQTDTSVPADAVTTG
ncbi:MAG: hypothetical protein QOC98_1539, partial [Frankiaceae bacterium]|nr:hypothetical protein [Frankiaceae bacterium]